MTAAQESVLSDSGEGKEEKVWDSKGRTAQEKTHQRTVQNVREEDKRKTASPHHA